MWNFIKRIFLLGVMNVAIMVVISLILNVLGVQPYLSANGINYQSLMIFCLLWGTVGSFISLQFSRWQAKKFMKVQLVDANHPQYGTWYRMTQRIAKSANLPMPEFGIYNSPEVNAFATGPSKKRSLVALSTGLLNNMSADEVEGVIAHEVSHIANGDMVTMSLVQGVMNAFVMFFARIAAFAIQNAMRSNDDERSHGGGFMHYAMIMAFEFLFGFIAMFVVAYFSRYREYRADSGAAKLVGSNKMIAALRRLQEQFGRSPVDKRTAKMNNFKISGGGVKALLSTHPKLEARIAALQRRA